MTKILFRKWLSPLYTTFTLSFCIYIINIHHHHYVFYLFRPPFHKQSLIKLLYNRFTSPTFLLSTAAILGLFFIIFRMAKKQDIVEAKKATTAELKDKK
jgi:hypothetical protein